MKIIHKVSDAEPSGLDLQLKELLDKYDDSVHYVFLKVDELNEDEKTMKGQVLNAMSCSDKTLLCMLETMFLKDSKYIKIALEAMKSVSLYQLENALENFENGKRD